MLTKIFSGGRTLLCTTLLVGLVHGSAQAQSTPAASLCVASGYVLGFFNGVFNDPTEAAEGMEALSVLVGDTHKGERVTAEVFYNTSGKLAERPTVTRLEDVAEVFSQRANELDGVLANRWEYFWELVRGGQTPLFDRLVEAVPAAAAVRDSLVTAVRGRIVAVLSGFRASPPTLANSARHNTRIQGLITERKKLLLVAHSQGNLFLNSAYSTAVRLAGADAVKAVHIAPASATVNGEYTLADIDLIIGALRALAPGDTKTSNVSIPFASTDKSGHKLIDTYLDSSRPAGRNQIKNQMVSALDSLTVPNTQGTTGFFTVTLTWDGPGDVDLHTFEPSGAHVFYSSKRGPVGFLDTDNRSANGPEHYFASCDASVLQPGAYHVGINNYSGATGRTATVQVASAATGELLTKTLPVGPVRGSAGNPSPLAAFTVTVIKSGTGTFSVSAQ